MGTLNFHNYYNRYNNSFFKVFCFFILVSIIIVMGSGSKCPRRPHYTLLQENVES